MKGKTDTRRRVTKQRTGRTGNRADTVEQFSFSWFAKTGNYAVVYHESDTVATPEDPTHTHGDFDEVVFVLGGSGIHVVDGEEHPLMRGDIFVLRGTHRHTVKFSHKLLVANVLYKRSRFVEIMPELARLPGFHKLFVDEPGMNDRVRFTLQFRLSVPQMDEINQTIRDMQREFLTVPNHSDFILESLFKLLVARICRFYLQVESMPRLVGAHIGVGKAISHIEQYFAEEVTVADLGRVAAMVPSTFHREFKKATGCSPIDYLIHLRIARAAEKLALQDIRVIDAAMSCGFNNSGYFTRKFREVMGVTPKDYAKKHR